MFLFVSLFDFLMLFIEQSIQQREIMARCWNLSINITETFVTFTRSLSVCDKRQKWYTTHKTTLNVCWTIKFRFTWKTEFVYIILAFLISKSVQVNNLQC